VLAILVIRARCKGSRWRVVNDFDNAIESTSNVCGKLPEMNMFKKFFRRAAEFFKDRFMDSYTSKVYLLHVLCT